MATLTWPEATLALPSWLSPWMSKTKVPDRFIDDEAKMNFIADLAIENVAHQGGPFAAAIFSQDQLIAPGVNQVMPLQLSIAHAEIMALTVAQRVRQQYHLHDCELVTSCEPCIQCFGAIIWSGVNRVISGATTTDAEQLGFDEGPKPNQWQQALIDRGIEVVESVQRQHCLQAFDRYRQVNGKIYNS